MSIKKYRIYLLMLTAVVLLVGAVWFFYYSEQEKTYKEGTLVQNECVTGEELA